MENHVTRLPDKNLLEGNKIPETTTGEFRLAMGNLRQYLTELLGDDSTDREGARLQLGAQEKWLTDAAGSADAVEAVFNPPVTQLLHGMTVQIRARLANTSTVPTLKVDETGALPVVKGDNRPLMAGDIAGTGHWLELKYDEPLKKWILQNPATGIEGQIDRIATAEGTGDTLTVRFSPPVTTLTDGMRLYVRATARNTIGAPVIQIDGLPDAIIGKGANQPLKAGDIAGAGHILELQWDEAHTLWSLQNPGNGIVPVELTHDTVITALGFEPYNSANPAGYITASAAVNSANYAETAGSVGGVANPVPKDVGAFGIGCFCLGRPGNVQQSVPSGSATGNLHLVYFENEGRHQSSGSVPGTWRNVTNVAANWYYVDVMFQRIA